MQIQKIPLWSIDVHKIHIKEWALVKHRLLSIIPWDEINQRKNDFAITNYELVSELIPSTGITINGLFRG